MSEQGTGISGEAAPPSAGVDSGYLGTPEQQGNGAEQQGNGARDGFDRIYARMDELSAQQQAIADALSYRPDADLDYEHMAPDELADALGLTPEELAEIEDDYGPELDEVNGYIEQRTQDDIFDLVDRSVDARMADVDAEHAVEQRDFDFEDLRDRIPLLQDERTARAIVDQAVQLAEGWDPRVLGTPQFVGLIELVAKAHIADQAMGSQRRAQPPGVQLESAQGARVETPSPTSADAWGDRVVAAAERLRPRI